MDNNTFREVRCMFYERQETPHGKFKYHQFTLRTPNGSGRIKTITPPVVGDLIYLHDTLESERSGVFEVVKRSWIFPSFGSMDWNFEGIKAGPMLDLLVVKVDAVFANEAPVNEDGEYLPDWVEQTDLHI